MQNAKEKEGKEKNQGANCSTDIFAPGIALGVLSFLSLIHLFMQVITGI